MTTMALSVILISIFFMGMNTGNAVPEGVSGLISKSTVDITVEKPSQWTNKSEAEINILVESDIEIKKVEVKIGENGAWSDITSNRTITIAENSGIYVQVTDINGQTHIKNSYVQVFDRTPPIVRAKISKTVLMIEFDDPLSGVFAVYVDGKEYKNLNDNSLELSLKDITSGEYNTISVYAVDNAGNRSSLLEMKNPLYKVDSEEDCLNQKPSPSTAYEKKDGSASITDDTKGSASTTDDSKGNASTTQNTAGGATGTQSSPPKAENTPNTSTSQVSANSESTSNNSPVATLGSSEKQNSKNDNGSAGNPLFGTFQDTNKQFMSIVTKDGHIFYMIVDHDKTSENVYLLTEVTNKDLMSFNDENDLSEITHEQSTENEESEKPTLGEEYIDNTGEDDFKTQETKPTDEAQKSSPAFVIILVVFAALGVGYYFKIYKPKKDLEDADDLDEYNFIEEGENINNNTDSDEDDVDSVVDDYNSYEEGEEFSEEENNEGIE